MKKKLMAKIKEEKPYLTSESAEKTAERLAQCEEFLACNVQQWLDGKELTDVWVRDKYCIGSVLFLRGNEDFISAFIALDDYAKDESTEAELWQVRR